jgi:dual-specificity kinase
MPSTSSVPTSKPQNAKKRQRSREPRKPDWKKFYEKGLPQEVIVIDDSPTPDPSEPLISHPLRYPGGDSRQPQKKRKRDDVGTAYDPIYGHSRSINHTPDDKDSASGSTISTDRTTSAQHTTAHTSLGSHSSNGQNGYEAADVQPGQKRKRTATRLHVANEAKRREQEVNGDPYTNYKPPPKPPIKAADVHVKVVPDVSSSTSLFHSNKLAKYNLEFTY